MMSVNKVILLGRLGQDPELKYTPGGAAVCNFTLATGEKFKDKSGQLQERTEWHRMQAWGKTAELCNQYLKKGSQAFFEGRIQTRSWDAKDGTKRYTTEIVITTVQFVGGQAQTGQSQNRPAQNNAPQSNPMEQEYDISTDANFTADDIPF
jgi:single-strand DNA-binding protein